MKTLSFAYRSKRRRRSRGIPLSKNMFSLLSIVYRTGQGKRVHFLKVYIQFNHMLIQEYSSKLDTDFMD